MSHDEAPSLEPGTTIGAFTLLQPLGEGGMGEVWEAEQRHPIRRRVALKLLKLGLQTRGFLARFEAERQALALMDHPNIAQVFEAGATRDGRPYYVMELVLGVPITEYCDIHFLTTRQRLELFASVCRGVQHAHQKGIIHRDLKPYNVLVTEQDNRPVPKIIDFGIAKALGAQLTAVTAVTEVGRPLGTPHYMSPEQWEAGQVDIDTRADIYSLGVMLYELLAGRLPFSADRILRAGLATPQMLRESTPPAPSTLVRTLGSDTDSLARARGTDSRTLFRQLYGDLDWITLKAMDPDRNRRYETAHALEQDLDRHLRSEPVQARPPSLPYRAGRFVRRNTVAVSTAAALVMAATAFTVMTVLQSRQIAVERDRARTAAAREGALNDFLQQTLLSVDPLDGTGRNTTILEALDSARARLERERPAPASVAASMESAIGWAYFKLAVYDRAEPLLRRALATRRLEQDGDSTRLAESLIRMASLHALRERFDTAATLFSEALSLMRRHRGRDDPELAGALLRSGDLFRSRGDTAAARQAFGEARGIFQRTADANGQAGVDDHLGALEYEVGNLDSAAGLFQRALDHRRKQLGEHALVASALANLGVVLEDLKRPAAAESAYREALRIGEKTLGPDHDQVTAIVNNLGLLLGQNGRPEEAEGLLRRAETADERKLGPDHSAVATDLFNLGSLLCQVGKSPEGEAMVRRSLRAFTRDTTAAPWQPSAARIEIGTCLARQRRFPDAERELLAGLAGITRTLGPAHRRADSARARLRSLYTAWGKPKKADSLPR